MNKTLRASEAAKIVGCSTRHLRSLIQSGVLPAKRVDYGWGFQYRISHSDAIRIRDSHGDGRGWPRGKPRKTQEK